MKRLTAFIALTMFTFLAGYSSEGILVVEGLYQNKNLYVSNSVSNSGIGFCAYEVTVNGDVTTDEVNSSAFEIDLSQHGLNIGEPVIIAIKHKEGCAPKILNPGVLQPQPTFETQDISISNDGMLEWSTTNEQGQLPFSIEQFKWNKWVKVGEVDGVGTPDEHDYKFKVTLTSGENKVRVVQRNLNGNVKISTSVKVVAAKDPVTLDYDKKTKSVVFSRPTGFEVYDVYGMIRKRGFDEKIDMSKMEKGDYYINFDNSVEKIRRK